MAGGSNEGNVFKRIGQIGTALVVGAVGVGIYEGGKGAGRAEHRGAPVASPEGETDNRVEAAPAPAESPVEAPAAAETPEVTPNYNVQFSSDTETPLVRLRVGAGLPPGSTARIFITNESFTGRYTVPERAPAMDAMIAHIRQETINERIASARADLAQGDVLSESRIEEITNTVNQLPFGYVYIERQVGADGAIVVPTWFTINGGERNIVNGSSSIGVLIAEGSIKGRMLGPEDTGNITIQVD